MPSTACSGASPKSILVLSYSSNGYPDLDELVALMGRYKSAWRCSTGSIGITSAPTVNVSEPRAKVREYLIVGS